MIQFTRGNIFDANVDAIVNPVNTVGTMGKGLALAFKRRFPANFTAYENVAAQGGLRIGSVFVFDRGDASPRYIFNAPTKKHWRAPSELPWIEAVLSDIANRATAFVRLGTLRSIALPALGCGLGGLDWSDVKPMIECALGDVEADVFVYEPPV